MDAAFQPLPFLPKSYLISKRENEGERQRERGRERERVRLLLRGYFLLPEADLTTEPSRYASKSGSSTARLSLSSTPRLAI
jgi:hypothetical protein